MVFEEAAVDFVCLDEVGLADACDGRLRFPVAAGAVLGLPVLT